MQLLAEVNDGDSRIMQLQAEVNHNDPRVMQLLAEVNHSDPRIMQLLAKVTSNPLTAFLLPVVEIIAELLLRNAGPSVYLCSVAYLSSYFEKAIKAL